MDRGAGILAHCALETYSVLTRLPPPHRAPAALVRNFLQERFIDWVPSLTTNAVRSFLLGLPDRGISGGGSYDALIAATAVHAGVTLVTCDERARRIYEIYDVKIEYA